jgi:GNAT superfamily N-acetyltransferase
VLEVILARDLADVGEPDFTLDDVRDEWVDPGVDLARDSLVVEAGTGLAAYALCTPHAQDVYVHPDHCGLGIGAALLPLVEARALARGLPCRQYIADRNADAAALLLQFAIGEIRDGVGEGELAPAALVDVAVEQPGHRIVRTGRAAHDAPPLHD